MKKLRDTAGLGEHNLRHETARAGLRGPRALLGGGVCLVLGLSDTQVPLGAFEELITGWGPAVWI